MLKKVLWTEGTLLSQQHFQQWDEYIDKTSNIIRIACQSETYGILDYAIDESALDTGIFKLTNCSIIFKSGRIYQLGNNEESLIYNIDENITEGLDIYLSLPINNIAYNISGYPKVESENAAWDVDFQDIRDQYDTDREREIGFVSLNVKLKAYNLNSEDHKKDANEKILIARILPRGFKQYYIDENLIPPLVYLKANRQLYNKLINLKDSLEVKTRDLVLRRDEYYASAVQFNASVLKTYSLLESFNKTRIKMANVLQRGTVHPQVVYNLLLDFIGSLSAFSNTFMSHNVSDFYYNHDDLAKSFNEVINFIEKIINETFPDRISIFNFSKSRNNLYSTDMISSDELTSLSFFLKVKKHEEADLWIRSFINETKVASETNIDLYLASALPGVEIKHVIKAPTYLSMQSGYEYFSICKQSSAWEDIIEHQSIAVYVSQKFSDYEIDLVAVNEEDK